MKLIMENWRGYLTEEEMRSQIMAYLEENNITLTEEEIEEASAAGLEDSVGGFFGIAALFIVVLGAYRKFRSTWYPSEINYTRVNELELEEMFDEGRRRQEERQNTPVGQEGLDDDELDI